jgi:putative hydrolase of the HAD superfamily
MPLTPRQGGLPGREGDRVIREIMSDVANPPTAVIFDLGGTLVHWPDWEGDSTRRWALSYDNLAAALPNGDWPARDVYVRAMLAAEMAHWERVNEEHWCGPPSALIGDGFRRLGRRPREAEILAALDGYARAVAGWAIAYPDAAATLRLLRAHGYRLGLLSNTWWAAKWHNADLAAHGLDALLHATVYTSDLPHSKPHPSVFREVAARLGVEPAACVMVGDRMVDDVSGALAAGMRAVWKRNDMPWPRPEAVVPSATIDHLAELPALLNTWGGAAVAGR